MGARESKGRAAARLVEAGAIEAVVDCMHRHTDKAKFQEAVSKCRHRVLSVPYRLANFIHPASLIPDTPPDTQLLRNPALALVCCQSGSVGNLDIGGAGMLLATCCVKRRNRAHHYSHAQAPTRSRSAGASTVVCVLAHRQTYYK
jgi:hypothetical protein